MHATKVPTWLLATFTGGLTLALVVVTVAAVRQQAQLRDLRAQVDELAAEVERQRTALEEVERGGSALDDLLRELGGGDVGGLPEGLGEDGLDGLLDGLGEGGLEGLLDGLGEDGLEGLLDGLGGDELGGLLGCVGDTSFSATIPDAPVDEQVRAIGDAVAQLRGLTFDEEPTPVAQAPAEFREGLFERVEKDYTPAEADLDQRVLSLLGAIEAGTDLRRLALDLVSDQAAGYYDPRTGEVFLRSADASAGLGPVEQIAMAHELEHALADQVHGLPVSDDEEDTDDDAALAGLALVEGDATLSMQQFATGALGFAEQLALATDPTVAQSREQLDAYPHHLQAQLLFPYTEGLAMVCDLYADGGWAAVDAAYADPPTTTAQVLFPDRYRSGEEAVEPAAPSAPGGDWKLASTDTFGAAELRWLFEAPGQDTTAALDDAEDRAASWAGGLVHVWTDGTASALGLALREHADHPGLCESVTAWWDAVAATDRAGVVTCTDAEVRVGIAPDQSTAATIAG